MLTHTLGLKTGSLVDHLCVCRYLAWQVPGRLPRLTGVENSLAASNEALVLLRRAVGEANELGTYLADAQLREDAAQQMGRLTAPAEDLALAQARLLRRAVRVWVAAPTPAPDSDLFPQLLATLASGRRTRASAAALQAAVSGVVAHPVNDPLPLCSCSIRHTLRAMHELHACWLQWAAQLKMLRRHAQNIVRPIEYLQLRDLVHSLDQQLSRISSDVRQALIWLDGVDAGRFPPLRLTSAGPG